MKNLHNINTNTEIPDEVYATVWEHRNNIDDLMTIRFEPEKNTVWIDTYPCGQPHVHLRNWIKANRPKIYKTILSRIEFM